VVGAQQDGQGSQIIHHRVPLGKPLTSVGVCNVLLRMAARAGLSDRIHCPQVLRRSLASRMIHAGVTLKQIADFMGHTSIDTTAIYTKVDLETLSRVALPWPTSEGKAVQR
jgi:site-specific recombinase XerD